MVQDLRFFWETIVFALFWGHRVELQVVFLIHIHLLSLAHHLHWEHVKNYLVHHHAKCKHIYFFSEARLRPGLLRRGIGNGEAAFVAISAIEMRLKGGVRLSEVDESEHESRIGFVSV